MPASRVHPAPFCSPAIHRRAVGGQRNRCFIDAVAPCPRRTRPRRACPPPIEIGAMGPAAAGRSAPTDLVDSGPLFSANSSRNGRPQSEVYRFGNVDDLMDDLEQARLS